MIKKQFGRIAFVTFFAAVMVLMFAGLAFAEDCEHDWTEYDVSYSNFSDTQHSCTHYYYCEKCGDSKTETSYANHNWSYGEKYSFDRISDSRHSYKQFIECKDCYYNKTITGTENHTLDKYGRCTGCDARAVKNITLKPGAVAYVNENSWIKIKVSKTGYITVNTSDRNGEGTGWKLYNKSKALYEDADWVGNNGSVPVRKGTYYIKVSYDTSIKYKFSKDPSKKNYTKGKAVKLKKKKKAVTVIYPTAKKKTWKRYFKVKLPKKQYLRFKLSYQSATPTRSYYIGPWHIEDSKGNYIGEASRRKKNGDTIGYTSAEKLKKGTYYLVFEQNWPSATKKRHTGSVWSLKWY